MHGPDHNRPALAGEPPAHGLRVLELFSGIGGLSAAWPTAQVVAAVDVDADAAEVYAANFEAPVHRLEIQSVADQWLAGHGADVWWLSPPCTPFTRRGLQRDLADPRNRALLRIIEAIPSAGPATIALENVRGFESSRTFALLTACLDRCHYQWQWTPLCPSQMGWPNRRPRVYLIASRGPIPPWRPLPNRTTTLAAVLANVPATPPAPELWIDDETLGTRLHALHRVEQEDPAAVTACFTRAYGRSPIRSGSWLLDNGRWRRFAPDEVAALLGFPSGWRWPARIGIRRRWQLLGNSLSIPAVRYIISHIPASAQPA